MIVLLSGGRQVGKSTVCRKLVGLARRRSRSVGGILSIALFDEAGNKRGIVLCDIQTGEEHSLAGTVKAQNGPTVGMYHMHAATLEWGAHRVFAAIHAGLDLIVIDEIGPLELTRGEGFADVLPAVYAHTELDYVIVVRPELLDELARRLPAVHTVQYAVTLNNRHAAPAELAGLLWGERDEHSPAHDDGKR